MGGPGQWRRLGGGGGGDQARESAVGGPGQWRRPGRLLWVVHARAVLIIGTVGHILTIC